MIKFVNKIRLIIWLAFGGVEKITSTIEDLNKHIEAGIAELEAKSKEGE